MKIAMIMDAWDPIVGGGQIHVKNICKNLIENHDCTIDLFVRSLKSEDGQEYNKNEVLLNGKLRIFRCGKPYDFFYFPARITSIFSLFFHVMKNNKVEKYDIIHAHSFLGLLSGKIASFILKIPIVATIHGANLLDVGKRGLYYYIEKFLLTQLRYDSEISVGSHFLQYKNRNKNIKIIGNGVNLEDFQNIDYKKEKNFYKILFVGRFEWTKGIDILIEAIALIDKKILDSKKIEVHLIGYGYDEEKYKNLVKKHHLEKYIIFRGKIIGHNLIQEYTSSHLFILPSRTEGFGMTIIESMAAKTLVLATKCGGPEDIISSGKNGFLIEKENPKALQNKIEELLFLDEEKIDTLQVAAYNNVKENYTWDKIASQIYQVYNNLKKG